MAYLAPTEFVTKMIDAGESKLLMSTRDTLIRSYMGGAILALAAAFAVTVTVNTGNPLAGAILFPAGFILLYLLHEVTIGNIRFTDGIRRIIFNNPDGNYENQQIKVFRLFNVPC